MRVVVTRPEHSGRKTATRLIELGHQPILLPLSKPQHHPTAIDAALESQQFASLALTSAEALRALAKTAKPDALFQLPVLAVGSATASAAKHFGFEKLSVADGFATGMISMLEALQESERQKLSPLLYLAGFPRGETFEQGLTDLKIHFTTVQAYSMEKLSYSSDQLDETLQDSPPDVVILMSSEAAIDFQLQVASLRPSNYFLGTKFLCISAKVASELPMNLNSQSFISKFPTEQGIIELLESLSGT